jgi:hypothetical protein
MARINMEIGFVAYISTAFVMGFCYDIIAWFIRATTYSVHGVSDVVIFLVGSSIFHSCDLF